MQIEATTLVIKGNWNVNIFTPEWININLLGNEKDYQIQALVNFNELNFAYRFKDFLFVPRQDQIEISYPGLNDEDGSFLGVITNKLINALPHTPIKALGVNYAFTLNEEQKMEIIENYKAIITLNSDFNVSLLRQTKKGVPYDTNFNVELFDNKEVKITVNFHYHTKAELANDFIIVHYNEIIDLFNNTDYDN